MNLVMEHAHLAVPSSMVKNNVSVLWDLSCLCLEELSVLVCLIKFIHELCHGWQLTKIYSIIQTRMNARTIHVNRPVPTLRDPSNAHVWMAMHSKKTDRAVKVYIVN